jgi:acyl-CoA synthetase (AMP-forming)/AMP-acid ligase II
MMSDSTRWGEQVAVEAVNGIPYRMYVDRPRRVDGLLAFADRWKDRPYIIQGGAALTFGALQTAVANKVAKLIALGVKPGDRVFLIGWNGPEWAVNFWASLCAGAVPVLGNTWWTGAEIAGALDLTLPTLSLADRSAAAKMPAGRQLGPWEIDAASAAPAVPAGSQDETETAMIIFTSGTSGQPKAVVLSHRAVLARLHMTLHVTKKLPHQLDGSGRDVTLITGPLFHVGNMQALLRTIVVGETLVLSGGRYDPAEVLQLIETHKVSRWTPVPTMVSRLLDHPDVATRDVSSLKSISIGGAPVHAELMRRIQTGLPSVSPRIPTGYGLTENGGQATAASGTDKVELLGSTGRPLPCVEIKFLEHPGLPDGEILLRSPTQMSGYYGLAESPIDGEGWLHTGDLGRLDERGNLWITGRSKDMIIRGGENIAPVAVERALMTIPGVTECVVFGIPHADLGEEVMAVVAVDGDQTASQLQEQLRGKVASFALPSRWRVQKDALPTNQTGKIDKPSIRAEVLGEAAAKAN